MHLMYSLNSALLFSTKSTSSKGCRGLNPASGLVDAHRALVLGAPVDLPLLGLSVLSGVGLAAGGLLLFFRLQRKFVDHA